MTGFETIRDFEGWGEGKLLDFEVEKGMDCVKYYVRKSMSQMLGHWKRQSDRLSNLAQLQSASETISRMNTFSKHFMSCTALHHFHKTHLTRVFSLAFQCMKNCTGNPLKEMSFGTGVMTLKPGPETLLSSRLVEKWTFHGVSALEKVFIKVKTRQKLSSFTSLRLFPSPSFREILEKLEFEKTELAINLQNKTNEVNRLVDMLEECKGWEGKLTVVESGMKTESEKWKKISMELQEKLRKKTEEMNALLGIVKEKEEKVREMTENEQKNREKVGNSDELQEINSKLTQEIADLQAKLQLQIQETLDSEREKLVLLKKLGEKGSKRPVSVPKKTMKLEHSELPENQLALEIVRLNREVNKLKFEARTAIDSQKKAEMERDELIRQGKVKSDALERVRRENEQLAVSLSTDQYKSVQKLEIKIHKLKEEIAKMKENCAKLEEEKTNLQTKYSQEQDKTRIFEVENAGLRDQLQSERQKSEESTRALNTLNSLQERFVHLKEFGDKQIVLMEGMKREKMMMEEQIEGLKANLRATKSHLDKASGDSEAYARLLKQMEQRLSDCASQKHQAEEEVRSLRSRLSRTLA